MNSHIDIFRIGIDRLNREETIERIAAAIQEKRHLWIATVNTEWLMRSEHDEDFRGRLDRADVRVADGSGLLWAAKFLSLPWRGRLWAWWQLLYSGAALVLYPKFCRSILPDTVPGSWLTAELAREAAERGWRIFLLGAAPGVADKVAEKWRRRFPNLQVATSSGDPDQSKPVSLIKEFKPQLILVAYPATDQLVWLETHLKEVAPAVGIGIGGSLDYLAGAVTVRQEGTWRIFRARRPPRIINFLGLEWLWRLVTQPWRWRRIADAVPLFMKSVLKYKSQLYVNN